MHQKLRDFFDRRLEHVLSGLPERIIQLLDEVPLHVEDYPPDEVLQEHNIAHRSELCGLYTGMPIGERSVSQDVRLPDFITIYREGILRTADNGRGALDEAELIRQIRITVLHEMGHHHGFGETELEELGYG